MQTKQIGHYRGLRESHLRIRLKKRTGGAGDHLDGIKKSWKT